MELLMPVCRDCHPSGLLPRDATRAAAQLSPLGRQFETGARPTSLIAGLSYSVTPPAR
jgi:hypothetical protein